MKRGMVAGFLYAAPWGMNHHTADHNGRAFRCPCMRSFRLGGGRFGPFDGDSRCMRGTSGNWWRWFGVRYRKRKNARGRRA